MRADDQDRSAPPPPSTPGADKAFLGPEFLTWLFFELEAEGWELDVPEAFADESATDPTVVFAMGNRTTLTTLDATGAKVTLSGPDIDAAGEVLHAVRRGALFEALELQMSVSGRVYRFTLRGLDGGLSGVVFPDLLSDEADDGASRAKIHFDDLLSLRMMCLDEIEAIIDALYRRFITRRLARAWHVEDLSKLRAHVLAGLKARVT